VLLLLIFHQNYQADEQEHIVINDNNVFIAGILMRKEQIAIIALSVWLTVMTVVMLAAQSVDLGIFFIVSLIGFFIIVELITPKYVRPGYLRYNQYILIAGIVLFVVIVALKAMQILGL
jgi:hypothetical protein